jgi:glutamyl-tRNA synthetase
MKVLYAAITGKPAGLPLFESIEMLGRESALTRLRAARARLSG